MKNKNLHKINKTEHKLMKKKKKEKVQLPEMCDNKQEHSSLKYSTIAQQPLFFFSMLILFGALLKLFYFKLFKSLSDVSLIWLFGITEPMACF